jgi:hypothetical protein
MRRHFPLALVMIACWFALPASESLAQGGGGGGGRSGQPSQEDQEKEDAAKRKKDEEWSPDANLAPLPGQHNAGPCPYVKVLYDAGRYVEFKDNKVSASQVGFTGEIQNLSTGCVYKGADPIHIEMELLFGLGRGPQATGSTKDYTYWVAVTDRNQAVIAKQYFTLHAIFPAGSDRILMTDRVNGINIPRANNNVSGGNFEVLVGFEVTPEMADFNRQGKRFRVNSTAATTASVQAPPAQQ